MRITHRTVRYVLILASAGITLSTAFVSAEVIGALKWWLYGSGCIALLAFLVDFFGQNIYRKYIPEKKGIEKEDPVFTEAIKKAEESINKRLMDVRKKEDELARRLIAFHELTEFPDPFFGPESLPEVDGGEEYNEKTIRVRQITEEKTRFFFDAVRENRYYREQAFDLPLLMNDIYNLFDSIARIYVPDSKNPLLETNIESLLRAVNRWSIQMLIILERRPFDLKSYNINTMYQSTRKAFRAYQTWKNASSVMSYLQPLIYVGKFSMGSNPITLGGWWVASRLLQTGGKKATAHVADTYLLAFFLDLVTLVGNESALIYNGNLRYGDSQWIYGVELADMISRFPVSRRMLVQAMNEIGGLLLKSEYDRIFLYRCIAAHKSPRPGKFNARKYLNMEQRSLLAQRLEDFFDEYVQGNPKDAKTWRESVENRLGVRFQREKEESPEDLLSRPEKIKDCLRSLSGFLLDIKNAGRKELKDWLVHTRLYMQLEESDRRAILSDILETPPMIFDYPDLKADEKLVGEYLSDLVFLAAHVLPGIDRDENTVLDASRYFRVKEPMKYKKLLDNYYAEFLSRNLWETSPEKSVEPELASTLIALVKADETPLFFYRDIRLEKGAWPQDLPVKGKVWITGTNRRLMLFDIYREKNGIEVNILWSHRITREVDLVVERIKQRFCDDCRVTVKSSINSKGKETGPPSFVIKGKRRVRFENFFHCLIKFVEKKDGKNQIKFPNSLPPV